MLCWQHGVAGVTTHGQRSSVAPCLRGAVNLAMSRHSLVLEQTPRSSPSTTASVIFLGFEREESSPAALRRARR